MHPTKFQFIWQSGFRGEESKKSANQKQESPVVAIISCLFIVGKWISVFLAHLAKGNVSFCHRLASVVRDLSSVNFSIRRIYLKFL
jgi:hypothetical protein